MSTSPTSATGSSPRIAPSTTSDAPVAPTAYASISPDRRPRALIRRDTGTAITAARTAAASAVATRHLARGDARTLGVFGTGVQARAHVTMIARVRRLEEVLVSGRTDEASLRFAAWVASEFGLPARAASAADVALADVVACCTTSTVPLFGWVSPGAHVNAVGAFTPASREVPTDVVVGAAVYVDSREGAFAEAGDLLIPVAEGRFDLGRVVGEVGEVIAGAAPARQALPPR